MPPAPQRHVVRRNTDRFRMLPAAGRPGRAPAWPFITDSASAHERKLWTQLWKTPQAIVWDEQRLHRVVAMYCRLAIRAEDPAAPSSLVEQLRRYEEQLLLTPTALRKAYYEIESKAPKAKEERIRRPARRRLEVVA